MKDETDIAEILAGLQEYQNVLLESAAKSVDSEIARKFYRLANEHAELERKLKDLGDECQNQQAPASPFLCQIRSLGKRLRNQGELASKKLFVFELVKIEDRMLRRFQMLIDHLSDMKWRYRLSTHLDRLMQIRDELGSLAS